MRRFGERKEAFYPLVHLYQTPGLCQPQTRNLNLISLLHEWQESMRLNHLQLHPLEHQQGAGLEMDEP